VLTSIAIYVLLQSYQTLFDDFESILRKHYQFVSNDETLLKNVKRPTVCVTCVWAGVDSVWEQKKLEARKMLENAAESHTSGARFVGQAR